MKTKNIGTFLQTICILLIIGFAVRLGADYLKYDAATASVPFYSYIIERALEFILPSVIVFIAGKIAKEKCSK